MGMLGLKLMVFEGVHGGFGFGDRNVEGEMILETADALNLVILNTWFTKKERLFTYENGNCRTVVDYILSLNMIEKLVLSGTGTGGLPILSGESVHTTTKYF